MIRKRHHGLHERADITNGMEKAVYAMSSVPSVSSTVSVSINNNMNRERYIYTVVYALMPFLRSFKDVSTFGFTMDIIRCMRDKYKYYDCKSDFAYRF